MHCNEQRRVKLIFCHSYESNINQHLLRKYFDNSKVAVSLFGIRVGFLPQHMTKVLQKIAGIRYLFILLMQIFASYLKPYKSCPESGIFWSHLQPVPAVIVVGDLGTFTVTQIVLTPVLAVGTMALGTIFTSYSLIFLN